MPLGVLPLPGLRLGLPRLQGIKQRLCHLEKYRLGFSYFIDFMMF